MSTAIIQRALEHVIIFRLAPLLAEIDGYLIHVRCIILSYPWVTNDNDVKWIIGISCVGLIIVSLLKTEGHSQILGEQKKVELID